MIHTTMNDAPTVPPDTVELPEWTISNPSPGRVEGVRNWTDLNPAHAAAAFAGYAGFEVDEDRIAELADYCDQPITLRSGESVTFAGIPVYCSDAIDDNTVIFTNVAPPQMPPASPSATIEWPLSPPTRILPREPTPEMIEAAEEAEGNARWIHHRNTPNYFRDHYMKIWQAMYDAYRS